MRGPAILVGALSLAACQATTASDANLSVARPTAAPIEGGGVALGEEELRGTVSPERLKINGCLANIGLAPLPEGFAQTYPPMTLDQTDAFNACMARAA